MRKDHACRKRQQIYWRIFIVVFRDIRGGGDGWWWWWPASITQQQQVAVRYKNYENIAYRSSSLLLLHVKLQRGRGEVVVSKNLLVYPTDGRRGTTTTTSKIYSKGSTGIQSLLIFFE